MTGSAVPSALCAWFESAKLAVRVTREASIRAEFLLDAKILDEGKRAKGEHQKGAAGGR